MFTSLAVTICGSALPRQLDPILAFQMANSSSAVADLQSEIHRALVKEVELLRQKE
jgi:hypothetical protein